MAHYEDLSCFPYFGEEDAGRLVAVGWLEPGHGYDRGDVDPRFVKRLIDLLVDPWQPALTAGRHACSFCRISGGPATLSYEGTTIDMGLTNLFIPAAGFLYVAPSLIAHYIDAHEYAPPAEFCKSVIDCPKMRSVEYLRAIRLNGPKGLLRSRRV